MHHAMRQGVQSAPQTTRAQGLSEITRRQRQRGHAPKEAARTRAQGGSENKAGRGSEDARPKRLREHAPAQTGSRNACIRPQCVFYMCTATAHGRRLCAASAQHS